MNVQTEQTKSLSAEAETEEQPTVFPNENVSNHVQTTEEQTALAGSALEDFQADQRLQDLLKGIAEETVQLREFLTEESKLMNEICMSIGQIMKKLTISFDIPPSRIPFDRKLQRIILNEEGHLILFSEKNEFTSTLLAEHPPSIVMAVLWVVMPKLAEVVASYRKRVTTRIGLFRRLKMELETIARTVAGNRNPADPQPR